MAEGTLIVVVIIAILGVAGWLTFAGISIDAAGLGGHNKAWAFFVTLIWGPLATIVYCLRPSNEEVEDPNRPRRD